MEIRPKIFKIFYEHEIEKLFPNFNVIFIENDNYFKDFIETEDSYNPKTFDVNEIENVISATKRVFENNPDIEGIYVKHDLEAFIMSGVMEEMEIENIKNSSFESIFICHHKLYSRIYEENPIKYSYFNLFDENFMDTIPEFPFFMKPCYLNDSLHNYIIKNREQLDDIIKLLKETLLQIEGSFMYLAKKYLNLKKFPLATQNILICEEIVKDKLQVTWEGWADSEGTTHTYCISDVILSRGVITDFIIPSKLPQHCLSKIERVCQKLLQNRNFTNSFVNVELWVGGNFEIYVVEINPRLSICFDLQYKIAYNTDIIESAIHLSMGKEIVNLPETEKEFKYCNQSMIITKKNGKLEELINYEKILELKEKHKEFNFLIYNDDPEFLIENNIQNSGRVILSIFHSSHSYHGALEDSLRFRKEILKQDDYFL